MEAVASFSMRTAVRRELEDKKKSEGGGDRIAGQGPQG